MCGLLGSFERLVKCDFRIHPCQVFSPRLAGETQRSLGSETASTASSCNLLKWRDLRNALRGARTASSRPRNSGGRPASNSKIPLSTWCSPADTSRGVYFLRFISHLRGDGRGTFFNWEQTHDKPMRA